MYGAHERSSDVLADGDEIRHRSGLLCRSRDGRPLAPVPVDDERVRMRSFAGAP
jgi:hypothetical protein